MANSKILQVAFLVEVLQSKDWTAEHKIEHLKMCVYNKYIKPDEAIDLAIKYYHNIVEGSKKE